MKHHAIVTILDDHPTPSDILVKGWVRTFRGNRFIALNDGSTLRNLQCVLDFENTDSGLLKRITTGAAISVKGTLVESQGTGQRVEVQVDQLEILGDSDAEMTPSNPRNTLSNS
jgi:asparaginyl-tRNA synthetase